MGRTRTDVRRLTSPVTLGPRAPASAATYGTWHFDTIDNVQEYWDVVAKHRWPEPGTD